MSDHLLARTELFSPNYRQAAEDALLRIEQAFNYKIGCVKEAYHSNQINYSQFEAARKALLHEAAIILCPTPGETPAEILIKLRRHAVRHARNLQKFSPVNYVAKMMILFGPISLIHLLSISSPFL